MHKDRKESYDDLDMPFLKASISELARKATVARCSGWQNDIVVKPLLRKNSDEGGRQAEEQTNKPKSVHPNVRGSGYKGGIGVQWGRRDGSAVRLQVLVCLRNKGRHDCREKTRL